MDKVCNNCACYEVCFYANPGRTKECKLWQPKVVRCKDCVHCFHNGEQHMKDKIISKFQSVAESMACITLAQAIKMVEDL